MSLRPFPHPWLWRGLFALAITVVIVLSLVSNDSLRQVDFIGNDKVGHLLAYFVLMAFAVQLRDAGSDWSRAAFGLLLMSIALEFLQQASGLRRGDIRDVYANATGIVLGALTALTPARAWLLALDRRFTPRRSS
ncbi:MAG TPA: VanZ family protein [Patescibacteria group bacterium]|nr:VanZ family protein [Patescibacteria group bacterium]